MSREVDFEQLADAVEAAFNGKGRTLGHEWWAASGGALSKPSIDSYTSTDDFVDDFEAWEAAHRQLADLASQWMKRIGTEDHPDVYAVLLPGLRESGLDVGVQYYFWGRSLWAAQNDAEVVPVLETSVADLKDDPGNLDLRCHALDILVDCYRAARDRAATARCIDELEGLAQNLDDNATQAAVLRQRALEAHDQSLHHTDAVDLARRSLELRKSDVRSEDSPARKVDDFYDTFGRIARDKGAYSDAFLVFKEWSEKGSSLASRARAQSEVGFTHRQLDEPAKAAAALREAAVLGEAAGLIEDAARWRRAAEPGAIGRSGEAPRSPNSIPDALMLAEQVQALVRQDHWEQLAPLALEVRRFAMANGLHDVAIDMSVALAWAAIDSGQFRESRDHCWRAIDIAQLRNRSVHSLHLYGLLAQAYLAWNRPELADQTLTLATVKAEVLLDAAATIDEVRRIAVASHPLQLSRAELGARYGDPLLVASASSLLDGRSLATGLEAEERAFRLGLADDAAVLNALRTLRRVDVEREVRYASGQPSASELAELSRQHEGAAYELNQRGLDVPLRGAEIRSLEFSIDDLVGGNDPRWAVLSLTCTEAGVAALFVDEEAKHERASPQFLPWGRRQRRKTVLSIRAAMLNGERAPLNPESELIRAVELAIEAVRRNIAMPLAELLQASLATHLIVIPHGELAALPMWPLVDHPLPGRTLSLSTSWSALRHSTTRGRDQVLPSNGVRMVVPDTTGTLPHALTEQSIVVPASSTQVGTVAEFLEIAPGTTLMHVAGHGTFDERVPLRSGFVLGPDNQASSVLSSDYEDMVGNRHRLLTAAEIIADADLRQCELAVLSACESALGDIHISNEQSGLTQALLIAGCRQVISSHWLVQDAGTAVTMKLLYDELVRGGSANLTTTALSNARGRLKHLGRDEVAAMLGTEEGVPTGEHPFDSPYFRDAFSLYGNPATVPSMV